MNQLLFLCSGNYYRSRYAEEVFNQLALTASIDWRADSRGLSMNPNNRGPIARIVLDRLASLEVQPRNAHRNPTAAKESELDAAARVIAMSREEHYPLMRRIFPLHAERIDYWDVDDTGGMSPDVALDRIDSLVAGLIAELGAGRQEL